MAGVSPAGRFVPPTIPFTCSHAPAARREALVSDVNGPAGPLLQESLQNRFQFFDRGSRPKLAVSDQR